MQLRVKGKWLPTRFLTDITSSNLYSVLMIISHLHAARVNSKDQQQPKKKYHSLHIPQDALPHKPLFDSGHVLVTPKWPEVTSTWQACTTRICSVWLCIYLTVTSYAKQYIVQYKKASWLMRVFVPVFFLSYSGSIGCLNGSQWEPFSPFSDLSFSRAWTSLWIAFRRTKFFVTGPWQHAISTGSACFPILCAFCSRNREWTDFIRMISRSPRDNWDAHGVIRDQHRTRTYNIARDRATYRMRAALIIVWCNGWGCSKITIRIIQNKN